MERSVYNLTPDAGCQLAVLFIRNTTWSKILSRMWGITTNGLWVDIYESQSWASLRLSRLERRYHTCVMRNVQVRVPDSSIYFLSVPFALSCVVSLYFGPPQSPPRPIREFQNKKRLKRNYYHQRTQYKYCSTKYFEVIFLSVLSSLYAASTWTEHSAYRTVKCSWNYISLKQWEYMDCYSTFPNCYT